MGKMIAIHQQSGTVQAYLTFPEKAVVFRGAVIVLHEIWGLTEHIKSVADRLAAEGYYVLAPDLYSGKDRDRRLSEETQKAIFSTDEQVRYAAQPKLRALLAPTQTPQFTLLALSRLSSCFEYMYNQPLVHQRVSVVGFGLGGNYTYSMAMREPRLKAAVAFYGRAKYVVPELRHIACPIMSLQGGKDSTVMAGLDELTEHMKQAGVSYRSVVYRDSGHAFFNDTNSFAYNKPDAEDAWHRLVTFLYDNMS
jgi:carboxymethylenebutenolidase